jgi:tRNA (guanine37-N1)-methyltransferase
VTETHPDLLVSLVALFPEDLRPLTQGSILGRAQSKGALGIEEVSIRDFGEGPRKNVDDTSCGGGPGMILRADIMRRVLSEVKSRDKSRGDARQTRTVLLDAAGHIFRQDDARRFATYDHLILVCGRYEGVDARIHEEVDEIISIGDYVLTGGELAAGVVLDATARHLPSVLGNEASRTEESFEGGLLEYRQYTRPIDENDKLVPPVLLTGNHALIQRARRKDSLLRTQRYRPDLWEAYTLSAEDKKLLNDDTIPSLTPELKDERKH